MNTRPLRAPTPEPNELLAAITQPIAPWGMIRNWIRTAWSEITELRNYAKREWKPSAREWDDLVTALQIETGVPGLVHREHAQGASGARMAANVNIKEALEWSKANGGRHVSRGSPDCGTDGWIAWSAEHGGPAFVYKLTYEDLTADDWEPSAELIDRITNGRWRAVEPKPEGA
jgi:hypothetical protein